VGDLYINLQPAKYLMDNINIKIIAERLNLSASTVSRAFNGSPDINKNTRDRILLFAKGHNFLPNHYASNLRDKKTRTLVNPKNTSFLSPSFLYANLHQTFSN